MPKKHSRASTTPPVGTKNDLKGRLNAVAAVVLTVRVVVPADVPEMLTEVGLRLQVGCAVTLLRDVVMAQLRLTVPVKPFAGFIVIVLVPLAPWVIVSEAGDALTTKLGGGAATVRDRVVIAAMLPLVPVIVTVDVPNKGGIFGAMPSVSTLVPIVGLAPNDAVTPLGSPVAASATLPAKPFAGFTVIVLVALPPGKGRLSELDEDDSVKFGLVLLPPVRVTAKIATAGLSGSVRLSTVLALLSANE